jgi:glucokinase
MQLGIDIGGTTINLGLVDQSAVVRKEVIPSFKPGATKEETLEYLSDAVRKMLVPEVTSIGIGVPTVVDPVNGIAYRAVNIPSWDEVHLKEELEARFRIPVFVNNDANCFALGASARMDRTYPVLLGITLGTGLGMGVVCDGKLFCGSRCGVGELGSAPYNGADYEAFCSKQFFTARGFDGKEAAEAADAGTPEAVALEQEFGRHLGHFLTLVMLAYDPDCIVLGGGVARSFRHFRDTMMQTLRSSYPYSIDSLRIEVLSEGEIPVLGASLLS